MVNLLYTKETYTVAKSLQKMGLAWTEAETAALNSQTMAQLPLPYLASSTPTDTWYRVLCHA